MFEGLSSAWSALEPDSVLVGLVRACRIRAYMDGRLGPDVDLRDVLSLDLTSPWGSGALIYFDDPVPEEGVSEDKASVDVAGDSAEMGGDAGAGQRGGESVGEAVEAVEEKPVVPLTTPSVGLASAPIDCLSVEAEQLAVLMSSNPQLWSEKELRRYVRRQLSTARLALLTMGIRLQTEAFAVWQARRQMAGLAAMSCPVSEARAGLVQLGRLIGGTLPLTSAAPTSFVLTVGDAELNGCIIFAATGVGEPCDGLLGQLAGAWVKAAAMGGEALARLAARHEARRLELAQDGVGVLVGAKDLAERRVWGHAVELWSVLLEARGRVLAEASRREEEKRRAIEAAAAKAPVEVETVVKAEVREAEEQAAEAEAKATDARRRQADALKAAAEAQDEVRRKVEGERARLLGLLAEASVFKGDLQRQRQRFLNDMEELSQWLARVEELEEGLATGTALASEADALWDDISAVLVAQRGRFQEAVTDEVAGSSRVPDIEAGLDLSDVPPNTRNELQSLRSEVVEAFAPLVDLEKQVLHERSDKLYRLVIDLDFARIRMMSLISPQKAELYSGMGRTGWEQVAGALGQLMTVLEYRVVALPRRLSELLTAAAEDVPGTVWNLILLLLFGFGGFWWYRRGVETMAAWEQGHREVSGGWKAEMLWYLQRVHKPLVWLFVVVFGSWFTGGDEIRELAVLWKVGAWLAGGLLAVLTLDALVASYARLLRIAGQNNELRNRSLRMVGMFIVAGGMTLGVVESLLGRGVLHQWLGSLWGISFVAAAVMLLRWWKPIIWQRLKDRPQSSIVRALLAQDGKYRIWPAAALGGIYLLGKGLGRWFLFAASHLRLARHLHAWLFRRQVAKQAQLHPVEALEPIDEATQALLGPETPSATVIDSRSDVQERARLLEGMRIGDQLLVLVGDRGMGKTTILKGLFEELGGAESCLWLECSTDGVDDLLRNMNSRLGLPEESPEEEMLRVLRSSGFRCIIIDEAQLLVRPVVFGLAELERIRTWVRHCHTTRTTWVLGMGLHAWRYVQRAAGARMLADEVVEIRSWEEDSIGSLIHSRTEAAGIKPSFDGLMPQSVVAGGEVPIEALYSESWYYRLLWDYSGGNPAIALHFWAHSLFKVPDGQVFVRLFSPPPETPIESLPLDMLFLLRVMVQMGRATAPVLAEATRLSQPEVVDALRMFVSRGYVTMDDEAYQICWHWRMAILKTLVRQHLLVT